MSHENLALGVGYSKVHYCSIPQTLRANPAFVYHCEVYQDSLIKHQNILSPEFVAYANYDYLNSAITEVKKLAPYGFVEDWSWDDDFSVTFKLSYRNLNKRTIRYIDIYWVIQNGVGDVRKSGHFSGTGPVEYLSSGSWDWDQSYYFVAGDASTMRITKIILTYMDGTKRTLAGNTLVIDSTDDD